MTATVTVRDEWVFGGLHNRPAHEFLLRIPTLKMTVEDLIRARIGREVEVYNSHPDGRFSGLVQPAEADVLLNGERVLCHHQIDPSRQLHQALAAFERNGFMLLVDNLQVERLDEVVTLHPASVVTFLKLVPLVGG